MPAGLDLPASRGQHTSESHTSGKVLSCQSSQGLQTGSSDKTFPIAS